MAADEDATETRIDRPGGAYAVARWRDAEGDPCPKAEAVQVEITEYDASGEVIARTYAEIGKGP